MSVEFKNWQEICKEKDKKINELEGKFDLIIEKLKEEKNDFCGGSLQTVYYWKGIEDAIKICKEVGGIDG